jgi:predicted Co/Zn/Cd cation transporter (cation efflux family)
MKKIQLMITVMREKHTMVTTPLKNLMMVLKGDVTSFLSLFCYLNHYLGALIAGVARLNILYALIYLCIKMIRIHRQLQ